MVGAAFAGDRRLLLAAHGRNHGRATELRQLDQQLADATRAGVDRQLFPGPSEYAECDR